MPARARPRAGVMSLTALLALSGLLGLAGLLAGCDGGSAPASASASITSSAPIAAVRRYDARSLIGTDISAFPAGRTGPHGGILLARTAGVAPITVAGAHGSVAIALACCTSYADLRLTYTLGSSVSGSVPIADDQAVALDGRLIALHAIEPVSGQPRFEAQVIVFPAAAGAGLPVVR